ncbi:hypothetical protein ABIF79_005547 [Bradyrhizobium japonicum]
MQGRAGASHSANGTYSLAVAENAYEPNGNDDDSNASAGGGKLEPMPATRIPTPKMTVEIALAIALSIARSADCRHPTLLRLKRS